MRLLWRFVRHRILGRWLNVEHRYLGAVRCLGAGRVEVASELLVDTRDADLVGKLRQPLTKLLRDPIRV